MTTQEQNLEVVLNRLDKLEEENRRLKRVGLGLLLIAASVLMMGQASRTKVIEAQKFVLKDTAGKVHGEFSSQGDNPVLELRG